jgi:hypothetical protein
MNKKHAALVFSIGTIYGILSTLWVLLVSSVLYPKSPQYIEVPITVLIESATIIATEVTPQYINVTPSLTEISTLENTPENTMTPLSLENFMVVVPTNTVPPVANCHPSYIPCLPIVGDLDCGEISERNIQIVGYDEYRLDGNDQDGWGCEE